MHPRQEAQWRKQACAFFDRMAIPLFLPLANDLATDC
jgi:hypothetical protein